MAKIYLKILGQLASLTSISPLIQVTNIIGASFTPFICTFKNFRARCIIFRRTTAAASIFVDDIIDFIVIIAFETCCVIAAHCRHQRHYCSTSIELERESFCAQFFQDQLILIIVSRHNATN